MINRRKKINLLRIKALKFHDIIGNRVRGLIMAIFKGKENLGVTINSNKLGVIDFTKFSKLTMCSAKVGGSKVGD